MSGFNSVNNSFIMKKKDLGFNSDEHSDEEDEPKLKYERLGCDLHDILKKDSASAVCVNSKLIVLGTNCGRLNILDHQGNRIRQFSTHSTPVTMIDMDTNGDYIASCSHDKKVVVQGLYSTDNNVTFPTDCMLRSIALDPNYGKARSAKRIVIGHHEVIMYEKGIFNSLKPIILSEGSKGTGELVRNVKWCGRFLAWASDTSIKIYNVETRSIVSLIKRSHSLALGCDQYPPYISWQSESTLLIGWGDSVKVCRIRERTAKDKQNMIDMPTYVVEIVYMFTADFYICGIGPLDNLVVVLGYNKSFGEEGINAGDETDNNRNFEWRRPQIRVISPLQGAYEEISKDVLSIRNYQDNKPNNYHLDYLIVDQRFYIVSPHDIVVAKPREPIDRIQWLLEHSRFQDALEVAESGGGNLGRYSVSNIGQMYLENLMDNRNYSEVARLSQKLLGFDKEKWEQMILTFIQLKQIHILSDQIPIGGRGALLKTSLYQNVLKELLMNDQEAFLAVVKEWPKTLYNITIVISSVLELLTQNTNNVVLLRALACLYSNVGKHDYALAIYLKLQHTDIFGLIHRHSLYECVAKHICDLMALDAEECLKMCCTHAETILPKEVVAYLGSKDEFLYKYLDMLYDYHRELSSPYHNKLLKLLAVYDRTKILLLLRSSSSIDLQPALEITSRYNLSQEKVYLLVRMGNAEAALRHVLQADKLDWAIKICIEHSDPDLWRVLIDFSLNKPEYVRELLMNIGGHVDPLLIIKDIPTDMEIPGLRDALIKILHDCQLKITLQSGCRSLLVNDNIKLLEKLIHTNNAGFAVRSDSECSICNRGVCDTTNAMEIVEFGCRHIYHESCLSQIDVTMKTCVVCLSSKTLIPK